MKKKKDIMKTGLWRETRDFEIIFICVHRKENSKHNYWVQKGQQKE